MSKLNFNRKIVWKVRRAFTDFKALIQLLFIFVPAICLFFLPLYAAFDQNNFWYLFLFFVSWLPAFMWGIFAAKFCETFVN